MRFLLLLALILIPATASAQAPRDTVQTGRARVGTGASLPEPTRPPSVVLRPIMPRPEPVLNEALAREYRVVGSVIGCGVAGGIAALHASKNEGFVSFALSCMLFGPTLGGTIGYMIGLNS